MFKQLKDYCKKDICPMHMPGHKRNTDLMGNDLPYEYDITEIEGFDYLYDPSGLIKNIHCKAQNLYNCDYSFMLVNGSTGGILSAIGAITDYGDKILVARNCHKSVYNAIELFCLNAVYVMPEYNEEFNLHTVISPDSIIKALYDNPDAKAVVLTSPTYEGFVSDIKKISEIVHKHNIPLFVDEAHGAHFGLSDYFPDDAVKCGADMAVMGLHKTLPALTQCALLNVKSQLINIAKLKDKLSVFQTSSPSYILMSSIDRCFSLIEEKGERLFENYSNRLDKFYKSLKNLEKLKIYFNADNFDKGKIIISTLNCSLNGTELADILRKKYKIETEMAYDCYVIAMTSICDTDENFLRLENALIEIDSFIENAKKKIIKRTTITIPKKKLSISKLNNLQGESIPLNTSKGKISLEYIYAYPPGIPIITPGEIIDEDVIGEIKNLQSYGINLHTSGIPLEQGIFVSDYNSD